MKYKGIGSGGLACFFWFGGDFCDFKERVGLQAEKSTPEMCCWKGFICGKSADK